MIFTRAHFVNVRSYAKFFSRSLPAVIRVYDEAGNVIETHEQASPPHRLRPRILVCSIACLPDERHITDPRSSTAIVDKDRVCAGHLDVHLVALRQ
jgi:hypothetical protein